LKIIKLIPVVIVLALMIGISAGICGPGKYSKASGMRGILADTSGTDSISIVIGDGAGVDEEILGETFIFWQDSASDYYSIYNGFLGVNFEQDSGQVFQSRYTYQTNNVDGDLTVLYPMQYLYEIDGIRYAMGVMNADSVGLAASDTTGGPAALDISQFSYIRPAEGDKFFILEYYFDNSDSTFDLTGGKALFFCDIDVGDGIYDNLTGIDSTRKMIFQYSEGDDYCGMAQIFPDNLPQYGNFNAWYYYGTNALVDSITANPEYDVQCQISPGDHSVYLIAEFGALPAGGEKKVAFAFALGRNLADLQTQIDAARNLYFSVNSAEHQPAPESYQVISVYPNPFNASAVIEFSLMRAGEGSLMIYDVLGRRVNQVFSGWLPAGRHRFNWAGDGQAGIRASAGIYFLQVDFHGLNSAQKIIYLP